MKLARIAPSDFLETKLTGEQILHHGYQAHVTAFPTASDADMIAFSEKLFAMQAREMAERDEKTFVFVAFYLEGKVGGRQAALEDLSRDLPTPARWLAVTGWFAACDCVVEERQEW